MNQPKKSNIKVGQYDTLELVSMNMFNGLKDTNIILHHQLKESVERCNQLEDYIKMLKAKINLKNETIRRLLK